MILPPSNLPSTKSLRSIRVRKLCSSVTAVGELRRARSIFSRTDPGGAFEGQFDSATFKMPLRPIQLQ